jgi:hypothetical protein
MLKKKKIDDPGTHATQRTHTNIYTMPTALSAQFKVSQGKSQGIHMHVDRVQCYLLTYLLTCRYDDKLPGVGPGASDVVVGGGAIVVIILLSINLLRENVLQRQNSEFLGRSTVL